MNIERLQQLRRVVKAAPEDLWDMSGFNSHTDCGTAHCAAGWAALDPWFQEKTEILSIFDALNDEVWQRSTTTHYQLMKLFGLTVKQTSDLFYNYSLKKWEVVTLLDMLIRKAKRANRKVTVEQA